MLYLVIQYSNTVLLNYLSTHLLWHYYLLLKTHHGTIIDSYNKYDKQCEVSECEEGLCTGINVIQILVYEIKIAG